MAFVFWEKLVLFVGTIWLVRNSFFPPQSQPQTRSESDLHVLDLANSSPCDRLLLFLTPSPAAPKFWMSCSSRCHCKPWRNDRYTHRSSGRCTRGERDVVTCASCSSSRQRSVRCVGFLTRPEKVSSSSVLPNLPERSPASRPTGLHRKALTLRSRPWEKPIFRCACTSYFRLSPPFLLVFVLLRSTARQSLPEGPALFPAAPQDLRHLGLSGGCVSALLRVAPRKKWHFSRGAGRGGGLELFSSAGIFARWSNVRVELEKCFELFVVVDIFRICGVTTVNQTKIV